MKTGRATKQAKSQQDAPAREFGTELVKARARAGNVSVAELHRRTGISRTVIQAYEAGKYWPGGRELRLLCQALKVTPTRLLFATEHPFQADSPLQRMFGVGQDQLRLALFAQLIGILSRDEQEALVTLAGAVLEARHKDSFKKIVAGFEAAAEELQSEAPALGKAIDQMVTPKKVAAIERRVKRAMIAKGGDKPER